MCDALKLKDGRQFKAMFKALLTDPDSPMEQDPVKHDALLILADAWGAQNPEEAVEALDQLAIPDVRNPYLFFALAQWAEQDASSALAWIYSHSKEREASRLYLTAGAIRGLAKSNPDVAFRELLAMPPSPERRGAVDFLLRVWAQKGGKSLVANMSAIPEDQKALREAAFRKGINFVSTEDFGEVQTWATNLKDPQERLITQKALASVWAQRDHQKALEWADSLPDEDGSRSESLSRVATYWAREAPKEAGEWVEKNKGNPIYDKSARAVAWNTVGHDYTRAFNQVNQITNEDLRLRSFAQIGQMWLGQDPKSARDYLESTDVIPSDTRYSLLSNFY